MAVGSRKQRLSSQLRAQGESLPSVDASLDEFIARANETQLDVSAFNDAREPPGEDIDVLRRQASEQQLRASTAREQSLLRQLANLQGQLAEAEARAAVALTSDDHSGTVADLQLRLIAAEERAQSAEDQASKLASELEQQRTGGARAEREAPSAGALEHRLRDANARTAKALAAARAAAMGLTVSAADIDAIETGVDRAERIAPVAPRARWALPFAALLTGAGLAFAAAFVALPGRSAAPERAAPERDAKAAPTAPPPAVPRVPAPAPTVTPIAPVPTVSPIEPAPVVPAAPPPAAAKRAKQAKPARAKPRESGDEQPTSVNNEPAAATQPAEQPAPQPEADQDAGGLVNPF